MLEVDLVRWGPSSRPAPGAVRVGAFAGGDPLGERLARASGSALALALWRRERDRDPFVLSVGEAVRRGLPTAARASVLARSPGEGRLVEGQVGSELARRLARQFDAWVFYGSLPEGDALLWLDANGDLRLERRADLRGLAPARLPEALAADFPDTSWLRVGLGGERGLPFANLAAGGDPPSFVGRGGLGAALGRRGLKAIGVAGEPVPAQELSELVRALGDSPRLAARAAEGGLEQAELLALRGEWRLEAIAPSAPPAARAADERWAATRANERALAAGQAFTRRGRETRQERHGCKGCPTPCGLVFERPGGERRGGRFSALHPLAVALGRADFDAAAALLDRCDDHGLDAVEVGRLLALFARHGARFGFDARDATTPEWLAWIDRIASGEGAGALAADGAEALRVRLEGEGDGSRSTAVERVDASETSSAKAARDAARARSTREAAAPAPFAVALGQVLSARGEDPMRSFPFLLEGSAGARALLEASLGALPPGAEDPDSPVAKGRILWWHENLAAALDATGFCAFSAAGLLADGAADLEALARWILPRAWRDELDAERARARDEGHVEPTAAERLLALGASIVLAHHAEAPERARAWERSAAWARAGGALDEYRAWRGLARGGGLTAAARAAIGTPAVLSLGREVTAAGDRAEGCAADGTVESIARGTTDEPFEPFESSQRDETVGGAQERREATTPPVGRRLGRVELRGHGPLRAWFGDGRTIERALPAPLLEVLEDLGARAESGPASEARPSGPDRGARDASARDPSARDRLARTWLVRDGRLLPSVYRDGRRLRAMDPVHDGDRLELLWVVAGG